MKYIEGRRILGVQPMPDMPQLPANVVVYKTTREFTETTVPAGLLRAHTTKEGTWGRIVVLEGALHYALSDDDGPGWLLEPGVLGIVEPTVPHQVTPRGAVRFKVEFLRVEAP